MPDAQRVAGKGLRLALKGFIPRFVEDILREIDVALERLGISARAASIRANSSPEMIRDMRRGHIPSVNKLRSLCETLGLEFYVGRPRRPRQDDDEGLSAVPLQTLERTAQELVRLAAGAGGDPVPDDLWPVLAARRGRAVPQAAGDIVPAGARPVAVARLAAVLGGGAGEAREVRRERVWFRQDWLERHGVDPERCAVIGVQGDAMEPALPDGCSVLVDRTRTEWMPPRILALRTEGGLVARRAGHSDDGLRFMVSDHPAWPDAPLSPDAEILGQVRWVARTLD